MSELVKLALGSVVSSLEEAPIFTVLPSDIKLPEDAIRISYSQGRSYLTCRRKWGYEKQKYGKEFRDYFAIGSFVHAGVAGWYDGHSVENALIEMSHELKSKLEEHPNHNSLIVESFGKAKHFTKNYTEYATMYDDFDIVAVEQSWLVKIAPKVVIQVIIDGIVRNKETGKIYIMEHKTPAQVVTDHLDVDAQITLYCAVAEKVIGEEVHGIVYNLIRKKIPSIPKVLKGNKGISAAQIDTTPDIYKKALVDFYGSVEKAPEKCQDRLDYLIQRGNNYVIRLLLKRTAEEKEDILNRYALLGEEMRQQRITNGFENQVPNPTNDCARCDYVDLCKLSNRQSLLPTPDSYLTWKVGGLISHG